MPNPLKALFALRPATNSAEDLAASLARTRAGMKDARAAIEAATVQRDALLLDGDPAGLEAAEAALRDAQDQVERLGAMERQLDARYTEARWTSLTERAEQASKAAEKASADLAEWWREQFKAIAAILTEADRLATVRDTAKSEWTLSMQAAYETAGKLGKVYDAPLPKAADTEGCDAFRGFTRKLVRGIEERRTAGMG